MALKDRIRDALTASSATDDTRRAVLLAILEGAPDDDSALAKAISEKITAHEAEAGSLAQAGQIDAAKALRGEIAILREVLRMAGNEPSRPASDKPAPEAGAAPAAKGNTPLFSKRQLVMAAVAGGALVVALAAWFLISAGSGETQQASANAKAITRYADDRTMGDPKAPITILEYAAPSCPHCAKVNEEIIPQLKREYIDTGKVYYIFRVLPIMAADGAAEAIARCLPADKYFAFLDLLFRNQEKWDPEYGVTDVRGSLVRLSRIAGLNAAQVDACIKDPKAAERLNRIAEEGAEKYNLTAVPNLIIDGEMWRTGNFQWPELKAKLEGILAKR